MHSYLVKAIVLFGLLFSLACCKNKGGSRSTDAQKVYDLNSSINLELGELTSTALGKLFYTKKYDTYFIVSDITNDSRCPKGATCVHAGNATVEIMVINEGKETSFLSIYPSDKSRIVRSNLGSFDLVIEELQPYPVLDKKIKKEEYRLKFRLAEKIEMNIEN